jgi:hypothetical protein
MEFMYLLLMGVGMLVLIHVPAYRKGRCLIDWTRAIAASVGAGMVVFGGGTGVYRWFVPLEVEWHDRLIMFGLVLVLGSGILRFKRYKP